MGFKKVLKFCPILFILFLQYLLQIYDNHINIVFKLLLILIALMPPLLFSLKTKTLVIVQLTLLVALLLTSVYFTEKLYLPIEITKVHQLEGTVVSDSSTSSNLNQTFDFKIRRCFDKKGNSYSCKGVIKVIGSKERYKGDVLLTEGSLFTLDEKLFFSSNSCFLLKGSWVIDKRLKLLTFLKSRFNHLEENSRALVYALLFGDSSLIQTVKEKTVDSGAAHILALSGMHLQVIALFIATLIKGKKSKYFTVNIILTLYLFLVGFKSSLVRALLMLYLSPFFKNKYEDLLLLTYFVHILLFPETIMGVATLYSYAALSSLFIFNPLVYPFFKPIMPTYIAKALTASLVVNLALAPLGILLFGLFQPIGIIISLVIVPIATFILLLALLCLFYPIGLINYLANLFEKVVWWGSEVTNKYLFATTFRFYLLLLVVVLTTLALCGYLYSKINKRNRKKYDLGFSLRLNKCDYSTIREKQLGSN
ncbi:MAG: ComEC/Rec2 family competence protein [Sphaerochaetaceae bacterium]